VNEHYSLEAQLLLLHFNFLVYIDESHLEVVFTSAGHLSNDYRFHDKLKRYIKSQQQNRAADEIPVRVTNAGTLVTLRGPAPAVDTLAANVNAFVAQAIEDEKERGFTMSFEFPQKQ
jgi:hypothetical protein